MAKFCTKCGRKLEEGKICICQQQNQMPEAEMPEQPVADPESTQMPPNKNQQAEPDMERQMQPNAGPQNHSDSNQQVPLGANQQYRQTSGARQSASADIKNLFRQFKPMLKTPITRTRQLSQKPNNPIGFEMIGLRAIVSLVMVLIITACVAGKINDSIGGAVSSLSLEDILSNSRKSVGIRVPYFQLTFLVLALTAGMDFLEALFLKLFTSPKTPVYNYSFMAINVGSRAMLGAVAAVIDGVLLLLSCLSISIGLSTITLIIMAAIHIVIAYIQFGAYRVVIKNSEDIKVYRFALAKICTFLSRLLMLYVIAKSMVNQIVSLLAEL